MVQARTAGAWNLLLQAFLAQTFLTRSLVTQTWLSAQGARTQWNQASPALQPATQQLLRLSPALQRAYLEPRRSPLERRTETDIGEQGQIQFLSAAQPRHVFASRRAERDSQPSPPIVGWLPVGMTIAARFGRRQPAMALARDESDDPAPSPVGMALRIRRKHQRVEEHGFRFRRDLVIEEPRLPVSEMTLAASRSSRPQPDTKVRVETAGGAVSQAKPVLNTAQLTDEVLKQLDRRLIAARERRGKI
jgi:hypothetical protein